MNSVRTHNYSVCCTERKSGAKIAPQWNLFWENGSTFFKCSHFFLKNLLTLKYHCPFVIGQASKQNLNGAHPVDMEIAPIIFFPACETDSTTHRSACLRACPLTLPESVILPRHPSELFPLITALNMTANSQPILLIS